MRNTATTSIHVYAYSEANINIFYKTQPRNNFIAVNYYQIKSRFLKNYGVIELVSCYFQCYPEGKFVAIFKHNCVSYN